jgi:hypothetical protein
MIDDNAARLLSWGVSVVWSCRTVRLSRQSRRTEWTPSLLQYRGKVLISGKAISRALHSHKLCGRVSRSLLGKVQLS